MMKKDIISMNPYENNGVIRYPKEIVEDRYKAQHMQAVAVKKK